MRPPREEIALAQTSSSSSGLSPIPKETHYLLILSDLPLSDSDGSAPRERSSPWHPTCLLYGGVLHS